MSDSLSKPLKVLFWVFWVCFFHGNNRKYYYSEGAFLGSGSKKTGFFL